MFFQLLPLLLLVLLPQATPKVLEVHELLELENITCTVTQLEDTSKGFVDYSLVKVRCERVEPTNGIVTVRSGDRYGCGTVCVHPVTNEPMSSNYTVLPVSHVIEVHKLYLMKGRTEWRTYKVNVTKACICVRRHRKSHDCQERSLRRRKRERRGRMRDRRGQQS